jgi:hypothetical protein
MFRGGLAIDEVFSEIEPIGGNRCRLRWTPALKLGGPLAGVEPLLSLDLPTVQRQLMKRLERDYGRHSVRLANGTLTEFDLPA